MTSFIRMLRVIFAVWTLATAALASQTVEGHVVNIATGAGVPGVVVNLVQGGKSAYSATTDSQGHFRIEAVKDGAYTANYKAGGFFPVPNRWDSGGPPPFLVVSGGESVRVDAQMQPIGKISGRVLDVTGRPVRGASVWFHWENSLCRVPLCIGFFRTLRTDEKGEYSIADLDAPGTWIVSAAAPSSLTPPESRDDQRLGWAQTFYPGVTDPQAAARVMTGGELLLDIKLAAVPVHRVRGVVLDGRGDPVPKATVTLGKGLDAPSLHENTKSDGTFEFDSVADDEWRISTKVNRDGVQLWAAQDVYVKGRDLENGELRLTAPFSIHGKIVMEVPKGVPDPKTPGVLLAFNAGPASGDRGFLTSTPDGKSGFTIQNVYPGPYLIVADAPPPQQYVDSIRLGDRDVLESDVQIQSGFELLTVTYKLGGGTVRGACAFGSILLIPQDPKLRRPDFIRRANCAQNGAFEIPAVRPGEYYGLAVAGDAAIWDEDLLKQASSVTVRANESTSTEIRLITR
jgi:hypothetical protein